MSQTIAAIATASAGAGIGVIRISGDEACAVADKVFKSVSGQTLSNMKGYSAAYGQVFDGEGKVDDCVALRFVAPKSYTGEDVVELSCHGGEYLLRRALRAVLAAGARMAQSGEFTRRAFLNGKLDLTAAESVMNLIGARGSGAHRAALAARDGAVFSAAESIKTALIAADADLAAWTDFPDEDVPYVEADSLKASLIKAKEGLNALISTAERGKMLTQGVTTAIVGKPNVGKSTVMNLLSGYDRSIVTDIAGTTRDVIEQSVGVAGYNLILADTAGIRATDDVIEAVGVELARKRMADSQLVIGVFDGSRPFDSEDIALMEQMVGRPHIAILNKCDLPLAADLSGAPITHWLKMSAKFDTPDGVEAALEKVLGTADLDADAGIIANDRQLDCVNRCQMAVCDAIAAIEAGFTFDAVGVCIDDGLAALCELTGERVSESVVDEVFSRFCVGK